MAAILRLKSHHNLKTTINNLITMDEVHAQVEAGKHYEAHINSPTLGDGGTVEMFFRTPDTSVRCNAVVAFGGLSGTWRLLTRVIRTTSGFVPVGLLQRIS